MSTVLWLHYLEDDQVVPVEHDLWALYKFAPQLDALCTRLGVPALSSFHDTTDAQANLQATDGEALDGWALVRDKGNWRPVAALQQVLAALHAQLQATPQRFGLLSNRYADVLAEIEAALDSIESHMHANAKVLLAVVL